MDAALRFGDVVKGFLLVTPHLRAPVLSATHADYQIDVSLPGLCVVLTPCCSIGENALSLAPLQQVRRTFFKNPYFAQDLTRINRRMAPEETLPSAEWASLSAEEKQRRQKEGLAYAFTDLFVYEGHPMFPEYEIRTPIGCRPTRCHIIDFRSAFRIYCEGIRSASKAPLEAKCLQLTIQTRQELRDKIVHYYGRLPDEDIA